jgi:biotin carboxylase
MNCIVFIESHKSGPGYDGLTAAKALGYETALLTGRYAKYREHFTNADSVIPCNTYDLEEMRNALAELEKTGRTLCAVVSFTEGFCHAAALLAREYNAVPFSPQAILTMQDKILTRKAISGTSLSPFFTELKNGEPLKGAVGFPLVLKEPMSTGSRGVVWVNDAETLEYGRGKFNERHPSKALLLEEYIFGRQYLVEVLVVKGTPYIAAVVEQEITRGMRFIVTGYRFVHNYGRNCPKHLEAAVGKIVKAVNLTNGPCHLELIHNGEEWKLVEINPRISGCAMNLLIETATGISLVKETLKLALGLEINLTPRRCTEAFVQYVTVEREGFLLKVTGRNKALSCTGVRHVYVKPSRGQLLVPPLSMGHRYAYVLATGKTAEAAKHNAKHAAGLIRFYVREPDRELLDTLTPRQQGLLEELYRLRVCSANEAVLH